MKKIKLLNMKIRNFKGFKEFELKVDGQNTNVTGDNATGKTTLYDAFLWCLFNKDSKDSAKFAWKPLDKNNNEIHHLETEVVLELLIDNEEIEFSRMNKEKWTKKRGSNTETFEGHDSTYRIDGIKQTQAKFKKRIEEIIDEETFKQITNVYYIAETMASKDRRKMLFNLVDELTDLEVIESKKELAPLISILGKHSIEDKRQLVMEERRNINKDLDNIPNRIDEVDRSINPDLTDENKSTLETKKVALSQKIAAAEEELANQKNGTHLTNLRSDLQVKVAESEESKINYQIKQKEKISGLQTGKQQVYEQAMNANEAVENEEKALRNLKEELSSEEKYLQRIAADKDVLRNKFFIVQSESFPEFDEHKKTCSLCNQELPVSEQSKIEQRYLEEKEAFNLDKASRLERINEEGKELAHEEDAHHELITELKSKIADTSKLESLIKVRDDLKGQHEAIKEQISSMEKNSVCFSETTTAKKLADEISKIKQEIISIQENNEQVLQVQKESISQLKSERNTVNESLNDYVFAEKQEARKAELIQEEKLLATRFGELDQQLFLLDEFTRTKVNLLTSKINARFEFVNFKLFEEQINGGLKEICEVTVNGIPYSSGLNNAARINAGLDIINTLTKVKEVSAPIFVDNAESINALIGMNTQMITLSVSKDKQLKVEVIK